MKHKNHLRQIILVILFLLFKKIAHKQRNRQFNPLPLEIKILQIFLFRFWRAYRAKNLRKKLKNQKKDKQNQKIRLYPNKRILKRLTLFLNKNLVIQRLKIQQKALNSTNTLTCTIVTKESEITRGTRWQVQSSTSQQAYLGLQSLNQKITRFKKKKNECNSPRNQSSLWPSRKTQLILQKIWRTE